MAWVDQDVMNVNCFRNKNEKVIVDSEGIKTIWRHYMEKMLNEENKWDQNVAADANDGPACVLDKEEVIRALSTTRHGEPSG